MPDYEPTALPEVSNSNDPYLYGLASKGVKFACLEIQQEKADRASFFPLKYEVRDPNLSYPQFLPLELSKELAGVFRFGWEDSFAQEFPISHNIRERKGLDVEE